MPDCVHAPMDAMQPARSEAILHLAATDPERQQLPPSDDPVLLVRPSSSQRSIDRLIQCGYTTY